MRRESRGMEVKRTTRGKESDLGGGASGIRWVPLLVPMRTRVDGLQGVHLATCDNVGRVASQRVGENLLTVCCACAFFGPACRFRGARAFKSSGVKGERGGMRVGRLAATQRGS